MHRDLPVTSSPTSFHVGGPVMSLSSLPARPEVASWLAQVAAGADPVALADAVRVRALAAAQTDLGRPVWIHLCDDDTWQRQIDHLGERLRSSDSRAHALQRFPLLGVPFAVKDNIDIAGAPTTAACPAFKRFAQDNATVVQRLLDAGALWVGKTNLDQFATGLVGTRSPFGRPASVFDPARISGGSSSGSAVAVASGLVAFSLGTDTAGSGRVPAGLNGLVGLKPTPGRVSTAGVLPACRSVDCVSVFAHSVDDAAHVLSVLEGPDTRDAYSHFTPGRAALPSRPRLGVPRQTVFHGDAAYEGAWPDALARTRELGADLVELDFSPLFDVAALLYEGPWVAERHAVLQALMEGHPQALDTTVLKVVSKAVGMTATDAFRAQYRLRELQASLQGLWQKVDALLVPTTTGHPTFDEIDADPVGANARLGQYTNFVNLLGWCALAVPAGFTDRGLPFGVTLIGPEGADAALAGWGQRWMAASEAPRSGPSAPGLPGSDATIDSLLRWPATEPTLALAVVGAHLSGLPLNSQLIERGAHLVKATRTAPLYRLYALPGTTPPKPGLLRVAEGGAAVEVEVWAVPQAAVGSFLALIPSPLGLGTLQLEDGGQVHGFLCEAHALAGAQDITSHGGWRAYLASRSTPAGSAPGAACLGPAATAS
jgi:allophanate hydrolase